MNRNGLWIVAIDPAAWIGFMLGYAVSSHTDVKPGSAEKAAAGGYGKVPAKAAGQPGAGGFKEGK